MYRRDAHLPFRAIEPEGGYTTVCDAWPMLRQKYGYLPSRRALSLALGRYSFPAPLRLAAWCSCCMLQSVERHCVFLKHSDDAVIVVRHADVTERSDVGCHDNAGDVIEHDVSAADL